MNLQVKRCSLCQSAAIRRKLVVLLAVPVFLVVAGVALRAIVETKFRHDRALWMEKTLPQLASFPLSNVQIQNEILEIKNNSPRGPYDGWVDEHVLLMTNGEFLIYAFRHGANSGLYDHLFLAHGSDGSWYYSTYHFCNYMVLVQHDPQPGSIAEFAKTYSVRQFDGKSKECLQHTWP